MDEMKIHCTWTSRLFVAPGDSSQAFYLASSPADTRDCRISSGVRPSRRGRALVCGLLGRFRCLPPHRSARVRCLVCRNELPTCASSRRPATGWSCACRTTAGALPCRGSVRARPGRRGRRGGGPGRTGRRLAFACSGQCGRRRVREEGLARAGRDVLNPALAGSRLLAKASNRLAD
jgi:hypothetical protein